MTELNFEPKKSTAQFLQNYQIHDRAKEIATQFLVSQHIKVIDYAYDIRFKRVWMQGKDRPDALLWKPELQLAFADFKGHTGYNWIINKRAYLSYIQLSERYGIPVFCIWVVISEAKIYYAKLPFAYPHFDKMPHDLNEIVTPSTIEVHPIGELTEGLNLFHQVRF